MNSLAIKYSSFWNWFVKHKNLLEETTADHAIIAEIDRQIDSLGNFCWEIGPGVSKSHSFTISPGGDKKRLELSKEIISYAPELDEWEFCYAKPIKTWDNYFDVLINSEMIRIDVSEWEYVLFRYEDGIFEIDIKPVPYFNYYENDLHGIADMVVCSIIGEEARIMKFAGLNVVEEFMPADDNKKSRLINLNAHLKSIG